MTTTELSTQAKRHQERVKQAEEARAQFLQNTSIFRELNVSKYGTHRPDWHIDNAVVR